MLEVGTDGPRQDQGLEVAPRRAMDAGVSAWVTWVTSWAMIGPSSRPEVT